MKVIWKNREVYNVEKLSALSKYSDLEFKSITNDDDNGERKKDISNIQYVKKMLEKKNDTTYKFTNIGNFGRVYSKFGLQGLSSQIRNYICHDICDDYDIVNCHPVLLEQLFHKNGLQCPNLTEYVTNRSEVLKKYNIDKQHMMFVMFHSNYFSNNEFFVDIHHDIYSKLIPLLIKDNKEMYEHAKKCKPDNPYGSFISNYLQTIENKILFELKSLFESNGYTINSLIFDGFLVMKDKFLPQETLDHFCAQITDWHIKLIKKPMLFDDLQKFLDENEPKEILISNYDDLKIEFEKNHFKCLQDGLIYEIVKNNVYSFSKTQTKDKYGHIDCVIESNLSSKKLPKVVKFINHWLEDNDMRTFKFVDFFFSDDDCPDDTFNLFLGFDVDFIETFEPNEEQKQDLQFILDHFKYLCNNEDDVYDYVMKWYAFMFKYPSKRSNTTIFMKSKQGVGKNISIELMFKLIGPKYCFITDNIERDAFGHFNPNMKDKLLIVFDEMDSMGLKYSDKIKSVVTGPTIVINEKNKAELVSKNNARYIFFSNNDFCVKIEKEDRRYLPIECELKPLDKAYFTKFTKIMNDTNMQRLFYDYLLSVDVDDSYDFLKNRPNTKLFQELKLLSTEPYEKFLLNLGTNNTTDDITKEFTSTQLCSLYNQYASENNISFNYNPVSLGIKLSKCKFPFLTCQKNNKGKTFYTINFNDAINYANECGFNF